MYRLGCLPVLLIVLLVLLLPLAFAQLFAAALVKLHLAPWIALLVVAGMFLLGTVNIPVRRISRAEAIEVDPLAVYGLMGRLPRLRRLTRETVIAVNVGGCLIPLALAIYEFVYLMADSPGSLPALVLSSGINILVCYRLARPFPGVGIALPGLIPPLVAALAAVLLSHHDAAPIAYVAGVLGPLVGADLLNLGRVSQLETGMLSIGGAGTFDGIVLSGIVAAYLA